MPLPRWAISPWLLICIMEKSERTDLRSWRLFAPLGPILRESPATLMPRFRRCATDPAIKGSIATIGWCFGGGIALNFAIEGEDHEGTAVFYGRLLDDPELLKHIHHEVYGTFAGLDRGPTVGEVDRFVAALRSAGVPNDVHVYDDVQHGFWLHVDRDPAANRAPAQDAWQRLLAYLERLSTAQTVSN